MREKTRDSIREMSREKTRESITNRESERENQRNSKPPKSSTRRTAPNMEDNINTSPENRSSKPPTRMEDRLGSGKVKDRSQDQTEARVKSGKVRPVSGKSRPPSSRAKSRQEFQRPGSGTRSRTGSRAGSRAGSWMEGYDIFVNMLFNKSYMYIESPWSVNDYRYWMNWFMFCCQILWLKCISYVDAWHR